MTLFTKILSVFFYISLIHGIPVLKINNNASIQYSNILNNKNSILDAQKKAAKQQHTSVIIDTNISVSNKFDFTNMNITVECQKVVNTYASCLKSLRQYNYDEVCSRYNTSDCKKIVKKKLKKHEACNSVDPDIGIQKLIDETVIGMSLSCGKTEDDKYCPIASYGKSNSDFYLNDDIILESCKSKSCRKIALDAFTKYQNLNEKVQENSLNKRKTIEIDRVESALEILNSDKCAAALVSSANLLNIIELKNFLIALFTFYLFIFV